MKSICFRESAPAGAGALIKPNQSPRSTPGPCFPVLAAALVTLLVAAVPGPAHAVTIVNISMPSGSMDGGCWPSIAGVYSEAPGPGAVGIGRIVDPAYAFTFSMHDHGYIAPHVPDPLQSVVTYQFDTAAVVTGLELEVHANGISRIEALIGDSLGSLVSLGTFTGSLGAPLGPVSFAEHDLNTFTFANLTPGLFFQFIVKETPLSDGYANYTAVPIYHEPTTHGVPDTVGLPTAAAAFFGVVALRRTFGGRASCVA